MGKKPKHVAKSPSKPAPSPSSIQGSCFSSARNFQITNANFVNTSYTSSPPKEVSIQLSGRDILLRNIAANVLYDSAEHFDPPRCSEDTRVALIEEIVTWIEDFESPHRLLVMTGAAGAGKSALEQSVAELLTAKGLLAATFFFSSADWTRNNPSFFIPTLAYQVALSNEGLAPLIFQAVEKDPLIFQKALDTQANTLLLGPWRTLAALQGATVFRAKSAPYTILIDGLDECHDEVRDHEGNILRALDACFLKNRLPFKIFLTSRPEHAIRCALFDGHLHGAVYHIDLSAHDATSDIRSYLHRRLRAIGRQSADPRARRPDWPPEQEIEQLVHKASGQFIYPATVVKYVSERRCSPFARLSDVLRWNVGDAPPGRENPFAALDVLYTAILKSAQAAYQHLSDDPLAIVRLVRTEQLLQRGRSEMVEYMEQFLALQPGDVSHILSDLHSLVKFVSDHPGDPEITFLQYHHKSFLDFLDDPRRSGELHLPFYVIAPDLLQRCFTYINLLREEDLCESMSQQWCHPVGMSDKRLTAPNTSPDRVLVILSLMHWKSILQTSMVDLVDASDFDRDGRLFHVFEAFSGSGIWERLARAFQVPDGLRKRCVVPSPSSEALSSTWAYRLSLWQNDHLRDFLNFFYKPDVNLKTKNEWQPHLSRIKEMYQLMDKLAVLGLELHPMRRYAQCRSRCRYQLM